MTTPPVKSDLVARLFPFFSWFSGYRAGDFKADLVAGLTVAVVLVPYKRGDAYTILFADIDHTYCRDICPYALFNECHTVKSCPPDQTRCAQ